jgi:aminopeptidase N
MRYLSIVSSILLCAIALPASAAGGSRFAAVDAAQGFLPKNVVPSLYRIDVAPNVQTGTIAGREQILVTVRKPAKTIVLNALQIALRRVTLDGMPAKVTLSPQAETATFTFAKTIPAGEHTLAITYVATLQHSAQGLFEQKYADEHGKPAYMFATQLEATDARRMFPSFDEPAFKARFVLSAVVPQGFTAVSNTPVVSVKPAGAGLKRVQFAPTPVMSTYLVVLCAGDFDDIHAVADGIRLGVYATRGKRDEMQYALHVMEQLMPYYDRYYGIKFPISKLDSIAIPGGFLGAMENWGGITYNEQTILFDPKKDPQTDKKNIFSIIAHEESHQWNGDLTTMPWWDELWLAEGFATWMQTKAPNHFHPGWQMYLAADQDADTAMNSDALPTTHAVYEPVHNNTQIAAVFDEISYAKAGAFLRMLEAYVGKLRFQQALQHYFRTHEYTSGNAADLWKDLSAVSGDDIAAIARNWIYRPGFPLVTASASCQNGKRTVTLSQQRYLFDASAAPWPTVWEVPLNVRLDARTPEATPVLLRGKTQTIDAGSCDAPLVINGDDVGFYRVAYDPASRALQRANFIALAAGDKFSLLDDAWAFAQSGRSKIDDYLAYVEADAKDANPYVTGAILGRFDSMLEYEKSKPGEAALKAYLAARLRPIVAALGGWEGTGMTDEQLTVRNHALRMLAICGDGPTIAEGKARFAQYLKDPASFTPLNRDAALDVAGYAADPTIYGELLQLAMHATSPDDQQRYFMALFSAKDKQLAAQTLAMTLKLPPEFASYAPFIVGVVGRQHPEMAWAFLNAHVKELFANVSAFERVGFVSNVAAFFWQGIPADRIDAFLKANVPAGGEKEIAKAMTFVNTHQEIAARLDPQIDAYVSAQGKTAKI